jgi:hypothetical protein
VKRKFSKSDTFLRLVFLLLFNGQFEIMYVSKRSVSMSSLLSINYVSPSSRTGTASGSTSGSSAESGSGTRHRGTVGGGSLDKKGGRRCHLLLNKRWNLPPSFLFNGTGCIEEFFWFLQWLLLIFLKCFYC